MDEKFFSMPQRLLLLIGEYYEKTGKWVSISEIYNQLNRNTHVWYNWQDYLVENGLITIKETRSKVRSIKKEVMLTEKGLRVYKVLKEFLTKLKEVG